MVRDTSTSVARFLALTLAVVLTGCHASGPLTLRTALHDDAARQDPSSPQTGTSSQGEVPGGPVDQAPERVPPDPVPPPDGALRDLDEGPYRTPRAGEGFKTHVFGRDVEVDWRDRRSVFGWSLGLDLSPSAQPAGIGNTWIPFGSAYIWQRPDDDSLFRGTLAGVFNEITYFQRNRALGEELGLAIHFDNFVIPVARAETIDGVANEPESVESNYVRPGIGLAWWQTVGPGHVDNVGGFALTYEPAFWWFGRGDETAPNFVVPEDTFESRVRLRFLWDAMERNLLELAHIGWATSMRAVAGWRHSWSDWGIDGQEEARPNYQFVEVFAGGMGGVPFVDSERHRLGASFHGGLMNDTDRFSSPTVGGGPNAREFNAYRTPVLPGSMIGEFSPEQHYAILLAEYRFEPLFFAYIALRGSIAMLDRKRSNGDGTFRRETDDFQSIGVRWTSGFAFKTRLQIDYNYNTNVIRGGDPGAHEVLFYVSSDF